MEQQTWWAQTLVSMGGGWSPDVYGLRSVQAHNEDEALATLAREAGTPESPEPAVLPQIERDARARGEDEEAIVEQLKSAVQTALSNEPKGLIVLNIGTDFAKISGIGI